MPNFGDSTIRFSSRVADYVAHRPSYPPEVVALVDSSFDLKPDATIVDIGSGTGISAKLILDELESKNVRVVGIEPNKEMREAGEEQLATYARNDRFSSVDGTAEQTGQETNSVDLITAAQAFHWFDVSKAREECIRILKKNGKAGVALIWNARLGMDANWDDSEQEFPALDNPVMSAYDLMLVRRGKEYRKVSHHKSVDEASLNAFFGPKGYQTATFDNPNRLDFDQLKGRLLSSSYTPLEGEEGHDAMMEELKLLFNKYQKDGKVDFVYKTWVFYGVMS